MHVIQKSFHGVSQIYELFVIFSSGSGESKDGIILLSTSGLLNKAFTIEFISYFSLSEDILTLLYNYNILSIDVCFYFYVSWAESFTEVAFNLLSSTFVQLDEAAGPESNRFQTALKQDKSVRNRAKVKKSFVLIFIINVKCINSIRLPSKLIFKI